ncbi:MAG: hypothetical protein VW802_05115 [Rhodospirillaceae bacterium]|jgi:hypothetical protein
MTTIKITEVRASSFYKSEAFGPANLIDGDKEFGGWITDVNAWQNAWIEFRFAAPASLSEVEICNGFIEEEIAKTRDDYFFHKRAKDIVIGFGEADPNGVQITLKDSKEPQIIPLNLSTPADRARITFMSVYDASPGDSITPYDVMGLRHIAWR